MSSKALYMEGLQFLASGALDEAIAVFGNALVEDQQFFLAHLGLATALDRQGKVDEAIVHVRKAIAISPGEALTHTSLSRLLQQKGLIEEAEEEMAISLRLQGES